MFSFDSCFNKVLILPLFCKLPTSLMVQFLKVFKFNFQKGNIVIFALIANMNMKRMLSVKIYIEQNIFYILCCTFKILIIFE